MDLKSKIILIYGPTASGKSEFAIKLAKKIKGEIVNADSMQVYKDLRILTARPLRKNFGSIKHHLYGFQISNKNFSTGDWLKLAIKKINEIKKRKKVPILVGGTGLYFKALTQGLVQIPNIPVSLRSKIRKQQKDIGQERFFKKLCKFDPLIVNQINPTDVQRSLRALEVKIFTKKSIIEWHKNTQSSFKSKDFYKLAINHPRSLLITKIEDRSKKMLKIGAISEVKKFLNLNISKDKSISRAIGISEIREYLKKLANKDEIADKISIKTRQYAKRQMTWMRGNMRGWKKINPNELNFFLKKI